MAEAATSMNPRQRSKEHSKQTRIKEIIAECGKLRRVLDLGDAPA